MAKETWDAFLKTMNNDPDTVVIDLTKKENEVKENLVNKFDSLFYEIENIDIQNMYLRDVLRLVPDKILEELIEKMKKEV